MLTPQDIQEKEFSKAVFGGYDMEAVDDFLEQVEADYTALYKDNAVLKQKLKVLVDKVEEYRSTEDAMRMALLTAQRMSDDMMNDTKKKCEEMLANAEREADAKRQGVTRDLTLENEKLAAAKAETAKFVSAAEKLVGEHADFLSKVKEMTAEFDVKAAEPVHDEPVRSPEPEPVPKTEAEKPAEAPTEDIDSFVKDIMNSVTAEDNLDATRRVPDLSSADESHTKRLDWTEEDEELTPRPKFKFDDLQFGTNYQEGK